LGGNPPHHAPAKEVGPRVASHSRTLPLQTEVTGQADNTPNTQTLATTLSPSFHLSGLVKPCRISPPPSPPCHHATGIPLRIYYNHFPLERGEDVCIDTVRVTGYGGAACLQHRKDFISNLSSASVRLHHPRDLISLTLWIFKGNVLIHLVASIVD
jgi:hypothetical protein